jgi:ubiquinone/menaquinone biosynthesis C-methylase UbiE
MLGVEMEENHHLCFLKPKEDLILSDVAIHKPHSKAKFVNCDARNLPFKDGTFNVVTCFHVIEHIEDGLTVLEGIFRVLKRGLASTCYSKRKKI